MDWETRRRKRQEMGGADSGNTSANVESSNSIADAWERRRAQRRQMDAGSEEARRQRSEEIDRVNQSRMEQHTRNKAQELAFAGLRSTLGSLQRAQYDSEYSYNTALMSGDSYEGNSVSNRQNAYKTNLGRIQELNDEIKALEDTAKNRAGGIWYMGHAADRQPTKAEQERIDSLKAERDALLAGTTKYERLRKTQDDYYGVTQEQDFGAVSKNRDFRNPTRDELSAYDARMNGSTYIGADGKTYDVFGDVVDENYHTRFAPPEIVDRLGMFLGASEAEKDQAAGTPLDMEGTWEKVLKDGMDASWDQLSDQEIDIYYYLLNTSGQETADQYLYGMKTELNRRSTNERSKSIDEATGLEKLALNLASVPANVFGVGTGFIEDTAHTLQGKEINPYSAAHSFSNDASAIRAYTAQDFDDMTGNGTFLGISLGDVYQSVMSGADSLVGGYTLGASGYGASMGMGAATAEAKDLYEKGASKEQVAVGGLLAGVAEGFFEKYSIENLLSMKDAKSIGQLVKNMLVQGGIEFSEELNTELANTISDAIVMGSQSEWNQFIQQHMEDGKSKKEATALAMVDVLQNMWKSGVGGFISGFLLGGTGSVASYAGYQSDMRQQGQQILDSGNYDTLQALAMDVAKEGVYGKGESELSLFAEKTAAGVKNLNENYDDMTQRQVNRATRNVGKLADRVDTVRQQQNAADIQTMLEKKGMAKGEAKRAAQLLSEYYDGMVDTGDKDLQRVMAKSDVQETMQEITENPESSVAQRNYRYNLGLNGLKQDENGVIVPIRSTSEESPAESVTKSEADKDATVEVSDGVIGKVKGIKWENGILTATVTTEAGETVSAPVEDVSMPSEMQDLVAVSKQFGESAPAVYAAYQPGMGVAEYGAAMKLARDYGYTGVSRSYADSSEYLNGLHPAQISIAYEAGQAAADTAAASQAEKNARSANGRTGWKKGTVRGEGVTIADLKQTFNDPQGQAYRYLSAVAEATGIDIVLYKSEANADGEFEGAQGRFQWNEDTIYIDVNAGLAYAKDAGEVSKYAMLRTFAHEFTHFIEKWNPVQYNEFRKVVFDTLTGRGENVHDLIEEKQAQDSSGKMTYEQASREVVAEAMTDILPDSSFVQELAEKHKSIFAKLHEKLKEFAKNLRDYFNSIGHNRSREANALKEQVGDTVKYLDGIVELFDRAAVQAVENYQKTVATEEAAPAETEAKPAEEQPAAAEQPVPEPAEKAETVSTDAANPAETAGKTPSEKLLSDNSVRNTADGDAVQEQSRAYLSAEAGEFRADIEDWEKRGRPEGETFILGSTGDVLQGLGAIESDIYMLGKKISAILEKHAEMTLEEIKKIPQILENPILILKSRNTGRDTKANTRIVMFGTVKAQNGLPVLAILDLKPIEDHLVIDDMQKVSSAYTKDHQPVYFVQNSDVLYADKKRTAGLLRSIGFQMPIDLLRSGYIGSISYSGTDVNISGSPFREVVHSNTVQEQSRAYLSDEKSDKKYSYRWFTSKPDMVVTEVDASVRYRASEGRKAIIEAAVANAKSIGFTNDAGNAVVHVADNGADVIVSKNGIKHSMDRRLDTVTPVVRKVGDILQNAIQVNNLNPREENVSETYVLMGMAKNEKNEPYIVSFVVNRYSNELVDMDVMYSVNAKKEPAGSVSPSVAVQSTGYSTGSVISIAEFLDFVNAYFPDVLPEDVLKHYGHDRRPDGILGANALYQQRTDTLTDREVLAVAASEIPVDDLTAAERDALSIFRDRLSKLEGLQEQRKELGQLYREQQFGKDPDREEAAKTLNRMHVLDGQIQRASNEVLGVEEKTVLRRVLQKARTVVEQQERQHGQEILKRWRDRRNNAAAIRKYRERIRKDVDDLTSWVLHPSNKDVVKHIPDALKSSVIPFLSSINFTSERALRGGEATKADKEFLKRLNGLKASLKQDGNADRLYEDYSDLPPNFTDRLQAFIDSVQELLNNNKSGDFIINQMTAAELKELSQVVRTLKTYIQNFNKFHVNAMFQHVYEAGDDTIQELSGMENAGPHTGKISNFVFWQQIRPAYAFERFGKGGMAIYDGLRRGQATLAFNTRTITEFTDKTYTAEEVRAWEKEIKELRLGDDLVKMPVSAIMSFYELSKRPHALGHILGEGIRVATFKAGGQKISDVGHTITPGDIQTIIGTLTERQKEVADNLQKFMQEQGGKWGNYVSVKRFGEELFGEEHYFPINSDGRHLSANADEHPSAASLYALLNMGFTKELKEKANNRIILYSIFDVFSNHMASMAQYNAFALPVVDALKWFNYQQKSEADENGKRSIIGSVRDQMDRVYGVPEESRPGSGRQGYAQNFVINILKAFNGTEAQGVPTDATWLNELRRYNMAQVAYNFRVVVQQPLAITRAGLLVDYASILKGMKLRPAAIRQNIAEMRRYSGIAAWKALGFYDVNISRGLTEIIKHKETVLDKVSEVGMWGAEQADTITWAAIWSACKEEVTKKQKLRPRDAGFYEAVTKLFEDVIYKTQVVDSVLTKNEYLRSKGFFARAIGSFMSEPTTTASMLIDAFDKYRADLQRGMTKTKAWKKNRSMIGRTAYVYAVSALILAAVQAAADALRDDDDYETFGEKWLEAFGGNLVDELMPMNKLPFLSDFYEVAKELLSVLGVDTYGNAPRSVFMQWYDSLVKGVQILHDRIYGEETNYTWYGGIYKLLQAVSGMTGLPMAAATREVITAWNTVVGSMAPSLKVQTYEPKPLANIRYAYEDGYLTAEEATAEMLAQDLVDSEDEAYFTIQGWEAGDGYSRFDAIFDAARNGGSIDAGMDELTAHGYTEKDVLSNLKGQIGKWYKEGEITKQQAEKLLGQYFDLDSDEITELVNKWSCVVVTGIEYDDIKQEYLDGNLTEQRAVEMRVRYGGYSKEDAAETVTKWKAEKETGVAYEDIKDAFLDGDISETDARNMYITYGGYSEEDAADTVTKMRAEKETGLAYDDIKDALLDGEITEANARRMYVKYGGYSEEEAAEKVTVILFVGEHPDCEDISYAAIEDYTTYCETTGVSASTFYDAWKYNSGTHADVDENGKSVSGSKKVKVLAYIDALPLTAAQKDSLYYAFGWAESTIGESPWH